MDSPQSVATCEIESLLRLVVARRENWFHRACCSDCEITRPKHSEEESQLPWLRIEGSSDTIIETEPGLREIERGREKERYRERERERM